MNSTNSSIPAESGTYIVVLSSDRKGELRIGRTGVLQQKPGYYLYVGSARGPGGLRARVGRHLRGSEKCRWHIDYLRSTTRASAAWVCVGEENYEHRWAQVLSETSDLEPAMEKFGASDCICRTHLFYSPLRPSFADFESGLLAGHARAGRPISLAIG